MLLLRRFSPFVIAAGLLSGALFTASAYGLAGGLLLMHGSIVPLFLIGFSFGTRQAAHASVLALLIVALVTTLGDAVVFALLIFLPALYMISHALKHRDNGTQREWYPILAIIGDYMLALSGFFVLVCVIGQRTEVSTLIAPMMQEFQQSTTAQPSYKNPEMARMLNWLVHDGKFLLVAWTGWIWVMLFYGFAVLSNRFLVYKSHALRPSLALTPQGVSVWLFAGLIVSALCSITDNSTIRLEGQAAFLLLLLPYFLSGIAWLHQTSRAWRGRSFWLGIIYGSLLMLLWPVAIVISIGLYTQLSGLFKHVPSKR